MWFPSMLPAGTLIWFFLVTAQGEKPSNELYRKAQTAISSERWQEAETHLSALRQLKPKDPEIYFLLGMVYVQEEKFADAAVAFRRSLELDPKNSEARYNLGLAYYRAGVYGRIPELYDSVRTETLSSDDLRLLGGAFVQLEDYPAAIRYFEIALKRQPNAETYYDAGVALLKGKEDRRAVEVLGQARQAFALDPQILLLSSVAAYMAGGNKDAESFLKRALDLAGDQTTKAWLWGAMGDLYGGIGQFERALDAYQQAVDLEPRNPKLLVRLGALLRRRGNLDQASEVFQRALQGDPDSVEACLELTHVSISQGKPEDALKLLKRVLRKDAHSIEAYSLLIRTYAALGMREEREEAARQLRRLKELYDEAHGLSSTSPSQRKNP